MSCIFLVGDITGLNIKKREGNNGVGFQDSARKFFNYSPMPLCYCRGRHPPDPKPRPQP